MSPTPRAPRAQDVLRYWLGAVRLEESLQVRPRARRTRHAPSPPRLDAPLPGQEYFKLPLDEALEALLERDGDLRRPLDGESSAFFEGWLHAQYGRPRDESELSHLLCFPVVHLPRGELAGLLRVGVRLRFGAPEGAAFRVPTRAERQRNAYPPAPTEARITRAPRGEGAWPFFIDTRLLGHPLGVSSEAIDALFEALRARESIGEAEMLGLVADTLEAAADERELPAGGPARALVEGVGPQLTRLRAAMQRLLARSQTRAAVYPVGIVIDGTQAKTTWHLQRELTSLLEAPRDDLLVRPCLAAYLTHTPCASGEAAQRALFDAPALTASQRVAAEHFWGSPFSAVQGPPGTGKTTLILHLCAEALVRQVEGLLDAQTMGSALLVIASGNNRAVDNVIDPLAAHGALPLALRVGSRQVCEHTLSPTLRATVGWLRQAQATPPALRAEALAEALARFESVRGRLHAQLAPRRVALAEASERGRLERALAALPVAAGGAPAPALSARCARAIEQPLAKLERRLTTLSEMCAAKPTMAQVNAVARHYEKTAKTALPALEAAVQEAGLTLDVPLPPLATPLDVAALMEVWEEGAESFLAQLVGLRERIAPAITAAADAERAEKLRAALAALGPSPSAPPPPAGGHDALSRALFAEAVQVREAWARVHASALEDAVNTAREAVERERSLRPFFRSEPERAQLFCSLFGVWGSTLLSLGNCLPPDPESVARVVIDEAGQCHPAHAVSALMRASAAMVIGDVFQLTPVIGLSQDDEVRLVRALRPPVDAARLAPYRVGGDSQVSAQSLADQAVQTRHVLVDHFRCHPEIIAVSNALCGYGLRVHTAAADPLAQPWLDHPLSLCDLRGAQERLHGSLWNALECAQTLRLVELLLARGARPADIAVITPYRGQLERLRRGLLGQRVPLESGMELLDGGPSVGRGESGLALGTVHRFQGGERPIVLFSSVITETRSLPFLNARPNLLNVAISRAQRHFVCLGDEGVLAQGALTRTLVEAAHPLAAG